MLGHLRFHRRGHSNPSSPIPDHQLSSFDHAEHPHNVQDISSRPDFLPRPTNAANTPPVPPSSVRSENEPAPNRKPSEQSLKDTAAPSVRPPSTSEDSGFMGGVTLQNYRLGFESTRNDSFGSTSQSSSNPVPTRTKPLPPPINTNLPSTRPPIVPIQEIRHVNSFVAPTDLQSHAGAVGKRPAGTRLTSEPPALAASHAATEPHRTKKGRPFLKNPMSGLLMRRKASQNAPDLRPLPLPENPTESTNNFQIKGTRIHDFSAPRQRVVPTRQPTVPGAEVWNGWDKYHNTSRSNIADLPLRNGTGKSSSATSEVTMGQASDVDSLKAVRSLSIAPSEKSTAETKRISLEDKPLPADPISPNQDAAVKSAASVSIRSRPASLASSLNRANPSTRTSASRHISLSDHSTKELSALPRHMKSTSSRFSFDMMGAARAEKLLEERHRQKELERKANPSSSNRDSRFDDFDEDSFDYDAAMDDDGLEEAIPGVNADYDDDYFDEETPFEEEVPLVGDVDVINDQDDPDNDQENFAGFVFSRSNPQSSLVSPATPGLMITPRDATGRPIGHAITKDRTPDAMSSASPLPIEDCTPDTGDTTVQLAGLGIEGLAAPPKTQYDPTVFQERRYMPPVDDGMNAQDRGIYFDGGLLEELQMEADEIQKTNFDESIFDDDDVDEFGRPLPGVFAQNKAIREQVHKQRDSDVTSPSGGSASTAHTSVSVGLQPLSATDDDDDDGDNEGDSEPSKADLAPIAAPSEEPEGDVAAYQKALVEAAHKAAASGWKSRWDDEDAPGSTSEAGEGEPDVTITSPTTGSKPNSAGLDVDASFQADDYEGYGSQGGFDDDYGDDDDYFDDAFIAEANAEALAYDSDGFYGDEFGFYSAPVSTRNTGSTAFDPTSGGPLANDSIYGGYFGPSGAVGRSASGRVLREPNLTPITERSEYSNRNSILSMVPPSAGLADLRSPGFTHMDPHMGIGDIFNVGELMRLRGKAFGGSQISLSSSRDGSPRSERAPLYDRFEGAASPAPWEIVRPQSHLGMGSNNQPHHERKNSAFSVWSNSDAASVTGSPTVTVPPTVNFPNNNHIPPPPLFSPPPPPIAQSSPGSRCLPVLEDEAEDVSSPGRTLKGTSVEASEASTSPVATVRGTPAMSESMPSPVEASHQDHSEQEALSRAETIKASSIPSTSIQANDAAFEVNGDLLASATSADVETPYVPTTTSPGQTSVSCPSSSVVPS